MIAIILVNWKNYDDTYDCLNSLNLIDQTDVRIIIVDNESKPEEAEKLKNNYPKITLTAQKRNLGFTGACNIGIKQALHFGAKYVMLLNNDTIITKDFLNPLLATLNSSPQIGAVQPKILFHDRPNRIWNAGGRINPINTSAKTIGYNQIDSSIFNNGMDVDWITGCCILLKSTIITDAGLLNDKFFAYYEDVDWSLRIRNLNARLVYNPAAKIYHKVGASSKSKVQTDEGYLSPTAHFLNIRNHIFIVRLYAKGFNVLTSHIFLLIKIMCYLIYFVLRGRKKKFKKSLAGFFEGYKTVL